MAFDVSAKKCDIIGVFAAHEENAGVAQLVERNLAKVEVESSRLFSRSILEKGKLFSFPFLSEQMVITAR